MPTYDFVCLKCKKKKENVFQTMSAAKPECCGEAMDTIPGLCSGYVFPKDGIHLEHVSAQGETFHSTKQMQRYARKNNLELGALL
jgi:hypothetical protein